MLSASARILLFLLSYVLLAVCHSHVEPIRRRPAHIPFKANAAQDSAGTANEKMRIDHARKQAELQNTANLAALEKERHVEESSRARLSERKAHAIAEANHVLKIAGEEEVSARKIAEEEARLFGKAEAKEAAHKVQMLARVELLQRAEESTRIKQLAEEMAAREKVKQEAEIAAERVLAEKQTVVPPAAVMATHKREKHKTDASTTVKLSVNVGGVGEIDKATIDLSASETAQFDREESNVNAEIGALSNDIHDALNKSEHRTSISVENADGVFEKAAVVQGVADIEDKDVQGLGSAKEEAQVVLPEIVDESILLSVEESTQSAKKTKQMKLLRKQQKAAAFAELAELNRVHKERKDAVVSAVKNVAGEVDLRLQLKQEKAAADAEAAELKIIRKQQKAVAAAEAAERKRQEKDLKAAARLATISKGLDSLTDVTEET